MSMLLKICGMKHNIAEVAKLQPDYLGFIFYDQSPRYFDGVIPKISPEIRKVGVFVNASIAFVLSKISDYGLKAVQLHGDEDLIYCHELRKALLKQWPDVEIWKVFRIGAKFDFRIVQPFEKTADRFLFDTLSAVHGGSGKKFDWTLLRDYEAGVPVILSGGIGPRDVNDLQKLDESGVSVFAVDVNSKFELEPGHKDISVLKNFKDELQRR